MLVGGISNRLECRNPNSDFFILFNNNYNDHNHNNLYVHLKCS